MKRNRLALVVALLVVVALGLATATLANPTTSGGGVGGVGGGSGVQTGDGGGGTDDAPDSGGLRPGGSLPVSDFGVCIPFLQSPLFLVLLAAGVLLIAAFIRWRANALVAFALLFVLFIPGLFVHALLTKCGPRPDTPTGAFSPVNISNRTLPVVGGTAGGAADTVTTPPVLLLLFVVVVAVLFALFVRGSGDDREDVTDAEPAAAEPALDGVADAAGDAADRIEGDVDVENAVYDAWQEMTGSLDIASPASTTPAEFALAARDAGMAPEHVDTLTEVFREVRYGNEPATEERERRALDALRDIEAAYGGDGK